MVLVWRRWQLATGREDLKLTLAFVGQRSRKDLFGTATDFYIKRIAAYTPVESIAIRDEQSLLVSISRQRARTPAWLVLLDSRGQAFTSEELARWLGARRDAGQQSIMFAIGPADGWTEHALTHAQSTLSFGPITLPHELARLVLAEQLYRAFTILAGHPYHSGH